MAPSYQTPQPSCASREPITSIMIKGSSWEQDKHRVMQIM